MSRVQLQHNPTAGKFQAIPNDAEFASDPPCYFPSSSYIKVPCLSVKQETHNSKVLTFGLPDGVSLNLPVSACIMMQGVDEDGEEAAKPYNPITPNSQLGSFSLLVKQYEEGTISKFAGNIKAGDQVGFCQFGGNVKPWRYPFNKKKITMVAVGTGITPMYQALYPLLKTPGDQTEVRLIYGNNTTQDIMLKKEIDAMAASSGGRLKVTYVVGKTANDTSGQGGEHGWIDAEKLKRLAFPPSSDSQMWICGTPGFYNSMAGSRMDPLESDSILAKLGYTQEMIWRS